MILCKVQVFVEVFKAWTMSTQNARHIHIYIYMLKESVRACDMLFDLMISQFACRAGDEFHHYHYVSPVFATCRS